MLDGAASGRSRRVCLCCRWCLHKATGAWHNAASLPTCAPWYAHSACRHLNCQRREGLACETGLNWCGLGLPTTHKRRPWLTSDTLRSELSRAQSTRTRTRTPARKRMPMKQPTHGIRQGHRPTCVATYSQRSVPRAASSDEGGRGGDRGEAGPDGDGKAGTHVGVGLLRPKVGPLPQAVAPAPASHHYPHPTRSTSASAHMASSIPDGWAARPCVHRGICAGSLLTAGSP